MVCSAPSKFIEITAHCVNSKRSRVMIEAKGVAIPQNPATAVEFKLSKAPFKIIKIRPGSDDQVPIATIVLGHPAKKDESIYGDLFLNGKTKEEANALILNEYECDLTVGAETPVMDKKDPTVQAKTQLGKPVVNRTIRLIGSPVCTLKNEDHTNEL